MGPAVAAGRTWCGLRPWSCRMAVRWRSSRRRPCAARWLRPLPIGFAAISRRLPKISAAPSPTLDNFNSFECRSRNRIPGAQLSEHGRANALDVRSFKFADGRTISLTDRNVARDAARDRAAFGVRAVFDGAGSGLRRLSRRPHPSRSDGAAQRLPDLPVERLGPRCRPLRRCCRPHARRKRRRVRWPMSPKRKTKWR